MVLWCVCYVLMIVFGVVEFGDFVSVFVVSVCLSCVIFVSVVVCVSMF